MSKLSPTIKGYLWWMYPRGSVPYDIMVTLILAFIFLGPIWINFRDKPVERLPHQTEIVVRPEGAGFVYRVDAAVVAGTSDGEIRDSLLRILEPLAGEISIDRYRAVHDSQHKLTAYEVWAHH
jgi:hypothetical protein